VALGAGAGACDASGHCPIGRTGGKFALIHLRHTSSLSANEEPADPVA
jgi:hypothetical protein